MRLRTFWLHHLFSIWKKHSVIWLSGVRKTGKSHLVGRIPGKLLINCNQPDQRGSLTEANPFFKEIKGQPTVIFDDFHRLLFPENFLEVGLETDRSLLLVTNASPILVQPELGIRHAQMREVYIPPVMWHECAGGFGIDDLGHRLFHGGLPEALVQHTHTPEFYSEWIDSYFAGEIQGYYSVRDREGFINLLRTLFRQSGQQLDISELSRKAGLSRPTVRNFVEAMTLTHGLYLVPPYSDQRKDELSKMPCAYACDTGLVSFCRGWRWLRNEDMDGLWRHLVLDCFRVFTWEQVFYWQTKAGKKVDFVLPRTDGSIDTFHCHVALNRFRPDSLKVFRKRYPLGRDFLVVPHGEQEEWLLSGQLRLQIIEVEKLREVL